VKIEKQLEILGQNLRRLREKRKYSQIDLAAFINTDKQNISKIENGRVNVTLKTLLKLTIALDCSLNNLLKDI
jgi:transcriptional regulator with XRE-family HTH domain